MRRPRLPLLAALVAALALLAGACADDADDDPAITNEAPDEVDVPEDEDELVDPDEDEGGDGLGPEGPGQNPVGPDDEDDEGALGLASARLASVQAATEAASTVGVRTLVEVLGAPGDDEQRLRIEGEGAFDLQAERGRLTADLAGLLGPMGGSIEQVFDASTAYVRLPDVLAGVVGAPTPWVRIDYEALADAEGLDLGAVTGLNQGDPTAALAWLAGATEVEELGTEDVAGERATRYRVAVDLTRLPELDAAEQSVVDGLAEAGLDRVPLDVWVDDQDRVRRVQVEVTDPAGTGRVRTTTDFSDYGRPVDVQLPPADQVTDLTELTPPAQGSSGRTLELRPAA